MGICFPEARMLWEARLKGVSFTQTLTVGRLALFLHPRERSWLRKAFRSEFPKRQRDVLEQYTFGEFSDLWIQDMLGASSLSILDRSAYEGANTIHDLNEAVPESLCGRFDAIVDGGSLEHIFNFPVAVSNLMRMLRTGGSLFVSTAANNLCGHGFYQFSPELMFRVFSNENGFECRRVVLVKARFPSVELTSNREMYVAVDPKQAGRRILVVSKRPLPMLVEAVKLRETASHSLTPLQSDYVALWKQETPASTAVGMKAVLSKTIRLLPVAWQQRIRGQLELRKYSLSNAQSFRKIRI